MRKELTHLLKEYMEEKSIRHFRGNNHFTNDRAVNFRAGGS